MEHLVYKVEQINEILNLINTLPVNGIDNCNKIVSIYQILNNNIKPVVSENVGMPIVKPMVGCDIGKGDINSKNDNK